MSTGIGTDKYYTPPAVASKALECAQLTSTPIVCADTACGAGSLLTAAEEVLQARYCLGIDNDPYAIRKLRRERPNWRLYVGDLLKRHRAPPIDFPDATYGVDLLVLNPPFSLGSKKYVSLKYFGTLVRCSVAMAHILRSLELLRPTQGAIAVVPESLLHSDIDQYARELLAQEFSLSELLQLSIYTFKGARVNSSFVQFKAPSVRPAVPANTPRLFSKIPATIVRGGLQMHSFNRIASGTRVIHSTSLKPIALNGIACATERTSVRAKGRMAGWLLLLPRVGIPKEEAFRAFYSKHEVQLSDCVIGMQFSTKVGALCAQERIRANWQSLLGLYRGTGARYVTIDRLVDWLFGVGVHDCDAMNEVGDVKLI
jgi:hypothetical protein